MKTPRLISIGIGLFIGAGLNPCAYAEDVIECFVYSTALTSFTPFAVPGGPSARSANGALGINDSGQIVGSYSTSPAGTLHAFLRDGDAVSSFDVPGADYTMPYRINNRGQIVGDANYGTDQRMFLNDGGVFTTFSYPGATATYGRGINDAGVIVGFNSEGHSFILDGGLLTPFDVPGATYTQAFDINNEGQIVGSAFYESSLQWRGFVKDGDSYTLFDEPSSLSTYAYGINDSGTIVGLCFSNTKYHGFIYDGSQYTTIDAPNSLYTVLDDINNRGEAVGYVFEGSSPSPSGVPDAMATWLLLGMGLAALGAMQRLGDQERRQTLLFALECR